MLAIRTSRLDLGVILRVSKMCIRDLFSGSVFANGFPSRFVSIGNRGYTPQFVDCWLPATSSSRTERTWNPATAKRNRIRVHRPSVQSCLLNTPIPTACSFATTRFPPRRRNPPRFLCSAFKSLSKPSGTHRQIPPRTSSLGAPTSNKSGGKMPNGFWKLG